MTQDEKAKIEQKLDEILEMLRSQNTSQFPNAGFIIVIDATDANQVFDRSPKPRRL
jgi:hypothetical protein